MARIYNQHTLKVLKTVSQTPGVPVRELFNSFSRGQGYKDFYNTIYRLVTQGVLERKDTNKGICVSVSEDGQRLLRQFHPEQDGVWKLVVFDIPEKHKYVRTVLRAKLKSLHFKKWQNSIWVSPFALDPDIEEELNELAKKFFVRLIKTREINRVDDLEKLFL